MAVKQSKRYEIVIPSYKRAGDVETLDTLEGNAKVAVHEFEADDYKVDKMVLPDSTKGNMALVRQFILDSSNSDWLIMIDDDVSALGYHEDGQTNKADWDYIDQFINHMCDLADQLNTELWGVNLISDPEAYRVYTPFSLRSPILGTFTAIKTSTTAKYDERLGLNEDYDMFIQMIFRNKITLRSNKWYYVADHLDKKGGCGSYRLLTEETKQSQIMRQKWGKKVSYNFNKSTNPRVRL